MTARSSVVLGNAREARTDWRVLTRVDATSLLEVELHTGRTHQIRVHFSALRHPVVGDTLYGAAAQLRIGKISLPPLHRNFLHAAKLGFAQPRTGNLDRSPRTTAARPPYISPTVLATTAGESPRRIDAALATYL